MLKIFTRALAASYIAYVAAIIFILLPAVNFLAPWYVKEQYGRDLSTDIILVNPFSLSLQIKGASLQELDGRPFASVDKAAINLSLQSLLGNGLMLDEVAVQGLDVHIRHLGDSAFNFSDLLPPGNAEPEPTPSGEIPRITIKQLIFSADQIRLTDEAREEPFSTHYDGIHIAVTDLTTIQGEGKPYSIEAVAESGGALQWEGSVSLPGAHSAGTLTISDLSLRNVWRFAKPWLNFELASGQLSLGGQYRISWAEGFSYQLSEAAVEVNDLDLRPLAASQLTDTSVSLNSFAIAGIDVDGDRQHISVSEVLADSAVIAGWSEGEQVSLVELFAVDAPSTDPEEAPETEESATPWTAEVADIRLENSAIQWRSAYTAPPQLTINPLSARAQSITWPLAGDSPLQLKFTLNGDTEFKLDGALALGSGAGEVQYQLSELSLPLFNPNLPNALKASLTDGRVNLQGGVVLNEFLPVEVVMDGEISDFSATFEETEEALTRWDSVRWQQLKVNLEKQTVYLEQLLIHDYQGRLHIREDGSVNASNVWQEEVGERAGEIAQDLDFNEPWTVDVPEVFISDSAIDFQDESLPIPFRTVIGDVNGEILNISSAAGASTNVDVKGTVDGYAPVVLKGSAAPFDELPGLNLNLTFTGVDLVLLTPYSGTYAGYAIERGLLSLDLNYELENNQLKGNNDIVIEQLKLGDKVDSDKALNLPLELALALLTDINGVIDLKVPVAGDVDDPKFAIGGVIASAVVNLITKAVTAPFSLLASLVGAEEDLQRVPYPVGSAKLSEQTIARLDQLYEALGQRPGLTLIIAGRLNLESDLSHLRRKQLDAELLAEGIAQEDIAQRGPDYMSAVSKRYLTLTKDSSEEVSFSEHLDTVTANVEISQEQLRDLAQDRAVATKEYLVNKLGLNANRAVINQVGELLAEDNTYSGIELELDI